MRSVHGLVRISLDEKPSNRIHYRLLFKLAHNFIKQNICTQIRLLTKRVGQGPKYNIYRPNIRLVPAIP